MKRFSQSLVLATLIAVLAVAAFTIFSFQREEVLATSVNQLKTTVEDLNVKLAADENTASSSAAASAANLTELENRQQIINNSQGQSLQDAVAAAAPAVVSIVESEEVPQLSVTYENPFGNDPFFQGFGMEVPVYQQTGTTTQEVSAGTGFLIRSDGYILTNKHVVPDVGATYTVLLANGTQLPGTVVWRDSNYDLAVVKIAGSGYSTIPLGDSSTLSLGETVFAIGNALGQYNNSVSTGVISGLDRSIQAQNDSGQVETLNDVIQTDAAINPGNSGGPLVTLNGEVVGVNVATAEGSQDIGFALPIDEVKAEIAGLGI
jgi:serine protease Do